MIIAIDDDEAWKTRCQEDSASSESDDISGSECEESDCEDDKEVDAATLAEYMRMKPYLSLITKQFEASGKLSGEKRRSRLRKLVYEKSKQALDFPVEIKKEPVDEEPYLLRANDSVVEIKKNPVDEEPYVLESGGSPDGSEKIPDCDAGAVGGVVSFSSMKTDDDGSAIPLQSLLAQPLSERVIGLHIPESDKPLHITSKTFAHIAPTGQTVRKNINIMVAPNQYDALYLMPGAVSASPANTFEKYCRNRYPMIYAHRIVPDKSDSASEDASNLSIKAGSEDASIDASEPSAVTDSDKWVSIVFTYTVVMLDNSWK